MMINFWLAVALSLIAATTYIWQSVRVQVSSAEGAGELSANTSKDNSKKSSDFKSILLIGVIFLLVPLGYFWLGNLDKQIEWQKAQQQFSSIKQGSELNSESNRIQELVLSLRTAVDKDPKNGQLWFMLAEVYFQLQMTDRADAALTRAIRIEMRPDWLVANAQVVTARGEEADIAKAEYLLRQAVQIQPDHHSALLTLGFVQLRQQKFDSAINNWEKLKQLLADAGGDTSRIQQQIDYAQRELIKKSRR